MLRTILAPTQVQQSGALPSGGLQGQVLAKVSSADGDASWVSVNTGTVDSQLNKQSTNPISNKAVAEAMEWKTIQVQQS